MNAPIPTIPLDARLTVNAASLPLRKAQRAAAALLDAPAKHASRVPAMAPCSTLLAAVSALSADDRERFARWLHRLGGSRQGAASAILALRQAPSGHASASQARRPGTRPRVAA